jgi:hypothetical protein
VRRGGVPPAALLSDSVRPNSPPAVALAEGGLRTAAAAALLACLLALRYGSSITCAAIDACTFK